MYKDRKETIKDLVHTNFNRLDEHFDNNSEKLNEPQQQRYNYFQDNWSNDPNVEEDIVKYSELVIMNHK